MVSCLGGPCYIKFCLLFGMENAGSEGHLEIDAQRCCELRAIPIVVCTDGALASLFSSRSLGRLVGKTVFTVISLHDDPAS